jgi:peptide/nickel transport system permease protein
MIGRIASSLLTLLLVSLLIFLMLEVLPGDVATRVLGRDATPESLAVLRERLNLDDPAYLRYGRWLWQRSHRDFGQSLVSGGRSIDILGPRIFNTLLLAAYAFILYIPLATLPALVQAMTRDRPLDHACRS